MRAAAACIVIVLACSSCGGGDRLSSRAFAREASAICRRVSRQTAKAHVPPLSEQHAAARTLTRLAAVDRELLKDLRDLEPPKASATRVTLWLAVIDQLLDEAEHTAASLRQGDAAAARGAADRVAELGRRVRALAGEHHVTGCRFPARRDLTPP